MVDWDLVIDRNRAALRRVLAGLVAMAGQVLCAPASPPPAPQGARPAAPTLSRHLHRAILRLLRPAESAARRLIVIAARGIVVALPPPSPSQPSDLADRAALRAMGIAIAPSPAEIARAAKAARAARLALFRRPPLFVLVDPLRVPGLRRRPVPPHRAPRILSFDGATPHRLPSPPAPDDRVSAARLGQRLAALGSALDDLGAQALRLARWKARRARANANRRTGRASPLKPGRPPGWRNAARDDTHRILSDLQYFARAALADTS